MERSFQRCAIEAYARLALSSYSVETSRRREVRNLPMSGRCRCCVRGVPNWTAPLNRDGCYGHAVTGRLAAMGIRDHPIAPRSPWQNGHAERLIGSIRWECLDHIIVFGDAHLHRILTDYTGYYNELRTHLSLAKDSPAHRPIQRLGQLV